jgi:tyrosine-protein kinase
VAQALRDLQVRIADLRTSRGAASRAAALDLQSKSDQLQTYTTLTKANAVLVRNAGPAAKIRPRPVRYGVFGIGLGLVLGIGLALLFELLDTRLRSTEAIHALLGLPLLARLSAPGRQLRRHNTLAMLVEPNSNSGEAFRMLRTNLEFVTFEQHAQVVMVISAAEEEGKTTTISNLAVALARAGRRVILVDLDLRRPSVDLFFPRSDGRRAGLTDVVLGRATLDQALIRVAAADGGGVLPNDAEGLSGDLQPNGDRPHLAGELRVLTTGLLPPDPGEFVGLQAVKSVISELRNRAEIILVDTPPLLQVGDAKVIARFVDASVVVVRAERATRPVVGELARVLAEWPAPPVGFVLCGADAFDSYYYSPYGYGYTAGLPVESDRAVGERVG